MIRLKAIITTTIVFICLGAALAYISPPLYKSTVEVLIERGLAYDAIRGDAQAFEEFIGYQKDLALSPAVLQKTIKDLHLDISERFSGKDIEKEFLKYIKVEVIGETLIKISAYSDDATFSVRIAQALAKNYVDSINKEKYKISEEVKEWILKTSSLANEIVDKESELQKAMVVDDIISLRRNMEMIDKKLETLGNEKSLLSNKIAELQSEQEESKIYEGKSLEQILSMADWPELKMVKAEYTNLNAEIERLSSIYTEQHPDIQNLEEEKKEILSKIKEVVDNHTKDVKAQINLLESQLLDIDKQIEKQKKRFEETLELSQKFASEENELNLLKENFSELLARIEQQGFYPISVSVLGLTPEEISPVSEYRDYRIYLIVSVALGIFVGILINIFTKPKMKKSAK